MSKSPSTRFESRNGGISVCNYASFHQITLASDFTSGYLKPGEKSQTLTVPSAKQNPATAAQRVIKRLSDQQRTSVAGSLVDGYCPHEGATFQADERL
jgi:hypothetical protein